MNAERMIAYREWVEAFKDSMLHEVEPVSLVDFNAKTVLDYAREMGLSKNVIENEFRPWILEGYKRAHQNAIQRLQNAAETMSRQKMEQAFSEVIESGVRLGLDGNGLEEKYGRFLDHAEQACEDDRHVIGFDD
jgi:hypothetical protein